ncbi:hypothetical protein M1O29_00610 [Dehalococcoidia bacterium]|nr:hypothetical protein [Dehalococcoidia bacterium]
MAEGASCNIIHLDAPREQALYGREDTFIPLAWNQYIVTALKSHPDLIEKFGREQIDHVVTQFPPPVVPFDHASAIRMAAEFATESVRKEMERDLELAKQRGADPYIALCLVPEGPTGTGVSWALMDWLPKWRYEYIRSFELAGIPVPDLFQFFLLEFVPARPDEDGNWENVRQGHITRKRLHERSWPYYWFRFDGAKVSTTSNIKASRIGARVMGMILTSRFAPVPGFEGDETTTADDFSLDQASFVDLPQALRSIDALQEKPVEVMISTINSPVDEEGCRLAGRILNSARNSIPLEDVQRLSERWSRYPEIGALLEQIEVVASGGGLLRRLLGRGQRFWRAREALEEALRAALDTELAGDLEGPNGMITYGDWYVKYPLTHDSQEFQSFLKSELKLSDIVREKHPGDLSTIRRSLGESVQARIIASDWAQPDNNIHPKFVKLIPFGSSENVETFGVDASVLKGFPSLNPTWEQASGGASHLSLVYVMMRSPVRQQDLGRHPLYVQADEQSSQHQRDERDPDKR